MNRQLYSVMRTAILVRSVQFMSTCCLCTSVRTVQCHLANSNNRDAHTEPNGTLCNIASDGQPPSPSVGAAASRWHIPCTDGTVHEASSGVVST